MISSLPVETRAQTTAGRGRMEPCLTSKGKMPSSGCPSAATRHPRSAASSASPDFKGEDRLGVLGGAQERLAGWAAGVAGAICGEAEPGTVRYENLICAFGLVV